MTLTLPIQVGRRYVRRDGKVVTIKLSGGNGTVWVDPDGHVYAHTGRASLDNGPDCPHDLVADLQSDQGHPHAELMALYAQDAAETAEPWKRWEVRDEHSPWHTCAGHPSWGVLHEEFRRKPKTIRIGAFDVPEPLRVAPTAPAMLYVVALSCEPLVTPLFWEIPSTFDTRMLAHGLLHSTREAAVTHAKALLSFTGART